MPRTEGKYIISTDASRLDIDVIHGFLASESYWARGISRDRLARAIEYSLCFGVYDQTKQVGFARVVTDRATFAYLSDVFILRPYRSKGLGKQLLRAIHQHPELVGLRRWLLTTKDAHGLYEKFGWKAPENPQLLMEILQKS